LILFHSNFLHENSYTFQIKFNEFNEQQQKNILNIQFFVRKHCFILCDWFCFILNSVEYIQSTIHSIWACISFFLPYFCHCHNSKM